MAQILSTKKPQTAVCGFFMFGSNNYRFSKGVRLSTGIGSCLAKSVDL
jgi:hypothetical protein